MPGGLEKIEKGHVAPEKKEYCRKIADIVATCNG